MWGEAVCVSFGVTFSFFGELNLEFRIVRVRWGNVIREFGDFGREVTLLSVKVVCVVWFWVF